MTGKGWHGDIPGHKEAATRAATQNVLRSPMSIAPEKLYRGDKTQIPLSQQDPLAIFNPNTTESLMAFTSTPGLYFTTSKENALHYGSNLTIVKLKPNARIMEILIPKPLVIKILNSHPDLNRTLGDYSENRREAFEMLLESIIDETDPVERLKAIWGDAQFSNSEFVSAMVKAGIDGIKVPKDPYFHYVIYNKEVVEELNS
jgi:hypothetical protein